MKPTSKAPKRSAIEVHCKFDEMIAIDELKDHPKNPNKHGDDQIERLAKLYKFHGVRHPIIVSKLSGKVVAGHGRKLSAIRAGMKEFPVVYQEFDSTKAEYAFMVSDNAIADWSLLDLSAISGEVTGLPDFDLDTLGIKDFTLDFEDKDFNPDLDGVDDDDDQEAKDKCPECGKPL